MSRRAFVAVSPLMAVIAATCVATVARAETNETDKNIAIDLFDAGVKKMEKGKCDETPVDIPLCEEARDDFRRSFELYPAGLGALRNLAYVEKGLGLVASAARSFRELERRAPLDPKPSKQLWAEFAKKELVALEPRIPRIQLKMPKDRPSGTKVLLDKKPLSEAAWGLKVDVDPGDHAIDVEAPGKLPFHRDEKLPEGSLAVVDVELVPDGTANVSPKVPVDKPKPSEKTSPRTAPLVFAGIGAAGVGIGLVFGYLAIAKHGDACDARNVCDPSGLDQGKSLATTSTIITTVSGAVLVGSAVWYFLTPTSGNNQGKTIVVPYAHASGAGLAAIARF